MYSIYTYLDGEWRAFGLFKERNDAIEWASTVHHHASLNHPMVEVRDPYGYTICLIREGE